MRCPPLSVFRPEWKMATAALHTQRQEHEIKRSNSIWTFEHVVVVIVALLYAVYLVII